MVRLFGTTITETKKALGGLHFGGEQPTNDDRIKAIGRLVVSCLIIFLAVFLFSTGSKDVGGTIVGAVCGYWLK